MESRNKNGRQSGVAILLVLVSISILTVIVFALTFSTGVHSRLSRSFHMTGQARYLSKSALNIALLRMYMYMNIMALSSKTKLPFSSQDLANLYLIPMPAFPFNKEFAQVFPVAVRIGLEKFEKESIMGKIKGSKFSANVRGLSGRIPINALDGEPERFSSQKIQKIYANYLTQIIEQVAEEDETWEDRTEGAFPKDLVNRLKDYIDLDTIEQPEGNLEDAFYQGLNPPEFLRHRRFKFLVDLALPKGWNQALATEFGSLFNLYGFYPMMHVNDMPSELWKVVLDRPTNDQLSALSERLGTKWFTSFKDLENFLKVQELSMTKLGQELKPLFFYKEQTAFEIESTGLIGDFKQQFKTIVILKPPRAKVQQEEKRIRKLVVDTQKKIDQLGMDPNDPQLVSWKDDPFNVFSDPKKNQSQSGQQQPAQGQTTNTGQGQTAGQPKQPKKKSGTQIFKESPGEMSIVHWGRSI